MKNLLISLLILLTMAGCKYQPKTSNGEEAFIAALDSMYRWDVEKQPGGALMFLDVPYVRQIDCDTCQADYLTLSVAKYDSKTRPGWIAVLFPNNIDRDQGIFLFFTKSGMQDQWPLVNDSKETSIRVNFEERGQETLNARFKDGYVLNEKNRQVDILEKFMDSDMLYLMVFYSNGDNKTISVPLYHFKKQYKELGSMTDFNADK